MEGVAAGYMVQDWGKSRCIVYLPVVYPSASDTRSKGAY
jgi:hypothetical protein